MSPQSTRGTNTTRLLVADVDDGRVEDVVARQEITRLGEGVDSRRRLLPLPIARVRNVLTDDPREAERLGAERALLVATSAVRDAENGEAFLGEIEWSYGFTTQLLGGEDEAELTFRGVTSDRKLERTTLLDIGGGSTELVVAGPAGLLSRYSIDIGSVRLTERFLAGDPPSPAETAAPARGMSQPRSHQTSSSTTRSASQGRSRAWRRSSSAWRSTTASGSTATA